MRFLVLAIAAVVSLGGCASAQPGGGALGSESNPVRADMPHGERAYLARLRCSNGAAPQFVRIGSMGIQHNHVIDGYDVKCAGAEPAEATIYMDMYHSGHVEARAVPGFTIVP